MTVFRHDHLPLLVGTVSVALFLLLWQQASATMSPLFLPSPAATIDMAGHLLESGALVDGLIASLTRILVGFGVGVAVGAVIGHAMGRSVGLSALLSPYVSIFRFIPTIAVLPLALLWLGPNEASKIFLVAYSTVFIVALGTFAAATSINEASLRAARSLGASEARLLWHVVIPASVPGMLNSALVALGFGFMVIVSAEMVGSRSGLGYLVSQGRQLNATSQIFVGILALGCAGLALDRVYRAVANRVFQRHGIKL